MTNNTFISIIHSGTNGPIARRCHQDRSHAFMSPLALHGTNYVYIDNRGLIENCTWNSLDIGTWMEFELDPNNHGHDRPRAINAVVLDITSEELMKRLRHRYECIDSMGNNYGSLRLDGLSRKEAEKMRDCRAITLESYYAFMSENGLQNAARCRMVEFNPGERLETARKIVEAIERKKELLPTHGSFGSGKTRSFAPAYKVAIHKKDIGS